MRLRQPQQEAILTGEEIASVRQVLSDCSAVLTAVQDMPGPAGAALGEVTRAVTAAKRSPGAPALRARHQRRAHVPACEQRR